MKLSLPGLILLTTSMVTGPVSAPRAEAGQGSSAINAEQWELARDGERIAALKPLRGIVNQWSSAPDKIIEIQYPGGEEGEIWVNEIRAWLISLGISSRHLMTVPGSGKDDVVRFNIINGGERFIE